MQKLAPTIEADDYSRGGVVARLDPGSGIAVQFREMNREGRERMLKVLEFVQKTTTFYNNRYLDSLTKS